MYAPRCNVQVNFGSSCIGRVRRRCAEPVDQYHHRFAVVIGVWIIVVGLDPAVGHADLHYRAALDEQPGQRARFLQVTATVAAQVDDHALSTFAVQLGQ